MPGLFSNVFHPGEEGDSHEVRSSEQSVDGGADMHLDPSITVSNTMSGSYEGPDGTTHSWERTDSVTLETDTQIVTHVTAVLTQTDESDGLAG